MRILGKVVLGLALGILILEAVLALFIALNIIPKGMIQFFLQEYIYSVRGQLTLIIGAVILGLVSFFLIYSDLREERGRLAISIPNPLGEVKISAEAIESFIRKEVEKMEEIKEIRSRVMAGKRGVKILNRVSILGGRNIPEVTDKIQSLIKDSTQNILGIPEIEEIKVFVREITQPKKERPSEEVKTDE